MFAPPVAKLKAKTATSSNDKSALQRTTPVGRRQGGVERANMLRPLPQGGRSLLKNEHGDPKQDVGPPSMSVRGGRFDGAWDFSKIPIFPPDRMGGFRAPSPFPALHLPGPI